LDVQYAPRFLIAHQDNLQVPFGSEINLDCTTSENPRRTDIQWTFTPNHMKASRKISYEDEGDNFVTHVLEEGLYECLVSNKIGSVQRVFNISLVPRGTPSKH
jgi:hypothetical protein